MLVGGGGVVKTWSSTQATVALSSGEAEYYALVRAAAEGLGMRVLMADLGWEAGLKVWVDSSAAKSMASRVGLGRVRHVAVKLLWLQDVVRRGELVVGKIWGKSNPADWLTKPTSAAMIKPTLQSWGLDLWHHRQEEWRPRWADLVGSDEEGTV